MSRRSIARYVLPLVVSTFIASPVSRADGNPPAVPGDYTAGKQKLPKVKVRKGKIKVKDAQVEAEGAAVLDESGNHTADRLTLRMRKDRFLDGASHTERDEGHGMMVSGIPGIGVPLLLPAVDLTLEKGVDGTTELRSGDLDFGTVIAGKKIARKNDPADRSKENQYRDSANLKRTKAKEVLVKKGTYFLDELTSEYGSDFSSSEVERAKALRTKIDPLANRVASLRDSYGSEEVYQFVKDLGFGSNKYFVQADALDQRAADLLKRRQAAEDRVAESMMNARASVTEFIADDYKKNSASYVKALDKARKDLSQSVALIRRMESELRSAKNVEAARAIREKLDGALESYTYQLAPFDNLELRKCANQPKFPSGAKLLFPCLDSSGQHVSLPKDFVPGRALANQVSRVPLADSQWARDPRNPKATELAAAEAEKATVAAEIVALEKDIREIQPNADIGRVEWATSALRAKGYREVAEQALEKANLELDQAYDSAEVKSLRADISKRLEAEAIELDQKAVAEAKKNDAIDVKNEAYASLEIRGPSLGARYRKTAVAKSKIKGGKISVGSFNTHVGLEVNGVPVGLCGSLEPLQIVIGDNTRLQSKKQEGVTVIEEVDGSAAVMGDYMGCAEVGLGKHVNLRFSENLETDYDSYVSNSHNLELSTWDGRLTAGVGMEQDRSIVNDDKDTRYLVKGRVAW